MSEGFVTADGVTLSVDTAGEGVPVVFLHGLCGDAGQTAEAFPPVPGFRRITIEARGHGRSEAGPLERLSIATFADDVVRYLRERVQGPVIIGGISMGAAISLRLAMEHPDLVRGLVLARPAWVTASAPVNMAPNAEVGRLLGSMAPEAAKAAFLASPMGQRLSVEAPDNLASLQGFFKREPIAVTSALLTRISADGPGVSDGAVAALDVPTLVIGHQQDLVHPLAHAEVLARMIPGALLVEITPKATSKADYVLDFHRAFRDFLKEFS